MLILFLVINIISHGGKYVRFYRTKVQMLARNLLCEVCANLIDFLKKYHLF